MSIDTVSDATSSPKTSQPFAELGLKKDEYESIREILGRRPTSSELAMYSVMWSEHCSYKSSKVHLRQFGTKVPENDSMLVGIGENAGVVDIGQGWAVTLSPIITLHMLSLIKAQLPVSVASFATLFPWALVQLLSWIHFVLVIQKTLILDVS